MEGSMGLSEREREVFEDSLRVMAEFGKTFGRPLKPSFVAELHVAHRLGLEICDEVNRLGFDARGPDGTRYQIKYRGQNTLNVDLNNFEFDEVILVNLDEYYQVTGMWQMTADRARAQFTQRKDYRKYQVTQRQFKKAAERIF